MNSDGTSQTEIPSTDSGSKTAPVTPAWSPDGQKIAFSGNSGGEFGAWEIYTINPDGSGKTRITQSEITAMDVYPDWSPDGATVVFSSDKSPNLDGLFLTYDIFTINPDGTGQTRLKPDLPLMMVSLSGRPTAARSRSKENRDDLPSDPISTR
jgi:Tol biopolymer transport system component